MAALSPAAPTRPVDPTMPWRLGVHECPAVELAAAVAVHDAAPDVTAPGDGVVERRDREP
ncbi:hypothetical protein F9L07_03030 [Pimelobacter simplex]|uniref:Uncharacterized protein n=1 Tax=Nocardioides simplex TaxID=2045 RepID=A0A7J5DY70_NOCSI|nr:hypothetical protein F9L07_03030 [Pimelobacter simplex]